MSKILHRKLSKLQRQLFEQVKAVLPACIAAIENQSQAEKLEEHIWQMRSGGLISDQEYQTYLHDIKQHYIKNGWEQPTT